VLWFVDVVLHHSIARKFESLLPPSATLAFRGGHIPTTAALSVLPSVGMCPVERQGRGKGATATGNCEEWNDGATSAASSTSKIHNTSNQRTATRGCTVTHRSTSTLVLALLLLLVLRNPFEAKHEGKRLEGHGAGCRGGELMTDASARHLGAWTCKGVAKVPKLAKDATQSPVGGCIQLRTLIKRNPYATKQLE
jgi:hypothetical protein